MQADLSKKDEQFREFSLNGPMWRVVLYVGFPLALYESLNQLFKILDTMMASHIGASAVSAVAYLSQINMMISAVGTGLAVGASIKVSQAYGAGDFMLVKKRVSTMFAMCGGARYRNTACPGAVHAGVPAPDEYTGRIYCGREHVFQAGVVRNGHHVFQ